MLRSSGLHFAGKTTQRMAATEIDVRETEAMMIIYAPTCRSGTGNPEHAPVDVVCKRILERTADSRTDHPRGLIGML